MNHSLQSLAILVLIFTVADHSLAIGPRGGGGFHGGGGGGARPNIGGGGAARPNFSSGGAKPNISGSSARPNVSNLNSNRGNPSIPHLGSSSRPSPSTGNVNRNLQVPQSGISRPNIPSSRPSSTFSNTKLPQIPSTRPNLSNPSTGIGNNNPSIPHLGSNRPSTLPGSRPSLPNTKPSLPSTRPSFPGNQPSIGQNRPGGNNNFQPSPGGLGDFLGMDKPIRPTTLPGKVPGGTNSPGTRPNLPDLANNRPTTRPSNPKFPNIGSGNNTINKRPGWVNIDNSTNINLQNKWQNTINNNRNNWNGPHDNHWNHWSDNVHHNWDHYHDHHHWYDDNWWNDHYHGNCGWHYHYGVYRPWSYWWTIPTWTALNSWFYTSNPAVVSQPVYYDYGQGGNVTYQAQTVYLGDTPIASSADFAASAAELATVTPPDNEQSAQAAEWMPLGTFAISMGEKDLNPARVVQLAISKDGIISGTLYNYDTDETQAVQGRLDQQTQRVAMRIESSDDLVIETGLYNLTQEQAPLLVHFGPDRTETWLLVRLEAPEDAPKDTP